MAFVLWVLLAGRMLLNDILLEPTVDEGYWLWNARCAHWGLPPGGRVLRLQPGRSASPRLSPCYAGMML
jgi:hypothetical protein